MNLGFAICGILGAKYGMGRKLLYFVEYPDNLQKALLVCAFRMVQMRNWRFEIFGDLEEKLKSAIMLPVLVARTNPLRDYLRPRQSLNYHHSVAHYRRSPARLDSIRRHLSSHRSRGGLLPVHHLPVQSSLILLAPRLTHQSRDLHQ